MLIHFIRNGPAYLPELDAYRVFLSNLGHAAQCHTSSLTVPDDACVVWWMCGRVSWRETRRLRRALHVHEYASASIPPHAHLKDALKRFAHPQPDFALYQNTWVRDQLSFYNLPYDLRDMGVAESFLVARQATWPAPEFDLVYLGEMTRLAPFLPVLQAIHTANRRLLLVGEVPDDLRSQLPDSVHISGRVAHHEVPRHLKRARFGLNLVGNTRPYNQQTSTKLLEYCAVGLPVVSNNYAWVKFFSAQHQGNFHLLGEDPASWPLSFGKALDAFPYVVPDVSALSWPQLLGQLRVWSFLGIR